MEIKRCGSRPSRKGPEEYFTGTVRVDPLFEAAGPARFLRPHPSLENYQDGKAVGCEEKLLLRARLAVGHFEIDLVIFILSKVLAHPPVSRRRS
jgi:hypothetical protein